MGVLLIIIIFVVGFYLVTSSWKQTKRNDRVDWFHDGPSMGNVNRDSQKRELERGRDAALDEIHRWMDDLEEGLTDVVVFDAETNGLDPERFSVLAIGAIRYQWDDYEILKEVGRFERFYYPKEEYNKRAIEVNGLTAEVIAQRRGNVTYPEHFDDDKGFKDFCQGVRLFAGHNISFDAGFVPFVKRFRKFDTMKSNTNIVCISNGNGGWKWPTLQETAQYYGVPFDELSTHGAMYDAEIAEKILVKMLQKAGVTIKTTT